MKESMLKDVRLRNGITGKYSTNDNQCMNLKFQNLVNYKAPDLPKFIHNVEEFVGSDQAVMEAAFAGTGQYHFVEEFNSFNVGLKWLSFSKAKKNGHFKKFLKLEETDRTMLFLRRMHQRFPQSMEAESQK